jgi:hypothetical protein
VVPHWRASAKPGAPRRRNQPVVDSRRSGAQNTQQPLGAETQWLALRDQPALQALQRIGWVRLQALEMDDVAFAGHQPFEIHQVDQTWKSMNIDSGERHPLAFLWRTPPQHAA